MTTKEIKIQLALGTLTDEMKYQLAVRRRTSKGILIKLSTDEDIDVRCYVADNPNTPIEALTILSKDEDNDVRCYIADNPNTPIEALTILSKDKYRWVRYWATKNPNTPTEVSVKL